MKYVQNDIIATLVRLLPLIMGSIDKERIKDNPRLANAIRIIQRNVLPRLIKITNTK